MSAFKRVLIAIVCIAAGIVLITAIQTVDIYTLKENGNDIVIGYNRGFGGSFTGTSFGITDEGDLYVDKGDEMIIAGFLTGKTNLDDIANQITSAGGEMIDSGAKDDMTYRIYREDSDGDYTILGSLDKSQDYAFVAYNVNPMEEKEAVDSLRNFQGTKGFGHWLSFFVPVFY